MAASPLGSLFYLIAKVFGDERPERAIALGAAVEGVGGGVAAVMSGVNGRSKASNITSSSTKTTTGPVPGRLPIAGSYLAEGLAKGEAARARLELGVKGARSVYSVAILPRTGQIFSNQSGMPWLKAGKATPLVAERMRNLAQIVEGSPRGVWPRWGIGACGDIKVFNMAIAAGGSLEEVVMFNYHARNRQPETRCLHCQFTTSGAMVVSDPPIAAQFASSFGPFTTSYYQLPTLQGNSTIVSLRGFGR
jgi:hypothetical protein